MIYLYKAGLIMHYSSLPYQWKLNFGKKIIALKKEMYSNSIYRKIVIYGKIRGAYSTPPSPANPAAAKFASQSDVHVRTNTQIKFLYYPLHVNIYIRNDVWCYSHFILPENTRSLLVCWCFKGVQNGYTGQKWVDMNKFLTHAMW